MRYHIVAYCSQNYLGCLDFSCRNWLMSDAESINIYTDFDPYMCSIANLLKDRVNFIPLFKQSENFSENCIRKSISLKHFMENNNCDNILMLDLDCIFLRNIKSVFKNKFDIGITLVKNIKKNNEFNNISAGILFLKNTPKTRRFVDKWLANIKSHIPRNRATDQFCLSKILKNNEGLDILRLSEEEYNNYPLTSSGGHIKIWKKCIRDRKPDIKILHFANGVWKFPTVVKDILKEL